MQRSKSAHWTGWSTYWLKVEFTIPNEWKDKPVVFIVDPSCEAMIWSRDGVPIQGITGTEGFDRHVDYPLTDSAKGGEVRLYH